MYKKLITYSLVILIMFNSAGFIVTFFQLKLLFREIAFKNIENYIPEEKTSNFVFLKSEFEQGTQFLEILDEKEFRYHNKMYDIIDLKYFGENVYVKCLSDENEDNLDKAFSDFLNLQTNSKANNSILKSIKNIINIGLPADCNIFTFETGNSISFQLIKNSLSNLHLEIPTPPPKI